jgi:hypothetical protein
MEIMSTKIHYELQADKKQLDSFKVDLSQKKTSTR